MRLQFVSSALLFPLLLNGCGSGVSSGGTSQAAGVTGSLKVASLSSKSASLFLKNSNRGRVSATAAPDATRLLPSSTAYAFGVVDGVKYHLTKIKLEHSADSGVENISLVKDVVFTDSSTQTVAINQAVTLPVGSYRGIALHFTNSWSVKSYCRTQTTGSTTAGFLTYTSATGVKKVDCSTGDCTVLPTDYDFTDLTHMNTYHGYDDTNDYQQETHLSFSIKATDTPILSILYDGSYSVACWDGGTWSSTDAFAGFSGLDSSVHPRTYFFPDSTPGFSTWYLPVFGYITTNSSEAAPQARTFAATIAATSGSASTLLDFAHGASPKSIPIVTLVYKSDGSIVAGSTRNFQGTGSGTSCTAPTTDGSNSSIFDLELSQFTSSSTGTGTDFFSSGWFWSGSGTPVFLKNRLYSAFNPSTTLGTIFTTAVTDGSDCGKTLSDFQNNNPSTCCYGTGNSATVYWKELTR